jgi:hypothetical protein
MERSARGSAVGSTSLRTMRRPAPARIRECRQADLRDTPCARRIAVGNPMPTRRRRCQPRSRTGWQLRAGEMVPLVFPEPFEPIRRFCSSPTIAGKQ